jgi:hypothetical protein
MIIILFLCIKSFKLNSNRKINNLRYTMYIFNTYQPKDPDPILKFRKAVY